MYRCLFRTVYAARNPTANVCKVCVSPARSNKAAAPVFRVLNGGGIKTLSTGSLRLCEKNDGVASSQQDGKTNEDNAGGVADDTPLVKQKAGHDDKAVEMNDQKEEPLVLTTDAQQADVAQPQPPVKSPEAKSGKKSLLDLLGAMKVEVTNKRRPESSAVKQSSKPDPTPTPAAAAAMESTISVFQKATEEASAQSETLDPKLVAAASAAASTLPNSNQAASELIRQLRQRKAMSEAQKKGDMKDLGEIIADMKVGRKSNRQNTWKANQIQFDDDGRGYARDMQITSELRKRRKLFTGKRLDIFSTTRDEDKVESAVARPTLWDMDFASQLSQSINEMPRNSFEEMIQWTKEGKLWQYPVNNEAGLEEEASVPFHEHIFLEKHLEEGFPRQGPVRHFMELVVNGLSRNPNLTVQQKKEHIFWFKDYFQEKGEILKEADVYLN
ncbi:small ribosomal subunit protein mS31 [Genypterus blacodes]|uniref:small ribosomal subunit protein mS31 n=1 Tax=Genypterus blacodes TaxID=154954 RepID=UPI003F76BB4B